MRKFIIIFLTVLSTSKVNSTINIVEDSVKTGSIQLSIQHQFGFIIPHRTEMSHLIRGHSRGMNLQCMKVSTGKKQWERNYQCPEYGLDFFYNYTGNAEQLGHQYALTYLIRLPVRRLEIISNKKKYFKHSLGLGVGLGYNTKTWDLENNSQSQVIGSHINAALTIEYLAQLIQLKNIQIRSGLRFTHFSNGAFVLPNLGTNNIALTLTLSHASHFSENKINSRDAIEKRNHLILSISGGLKEIPPPYGKKYGSITIGAIGERRFSYKSSLSAGTEVMFNSAVKTLRNREDAIPSGWEKNTQLSLVVGYGLHFNRMQLRILQGIYALNVWQADGRFYQRVSLSYAVTDQIRVLIGLKTHFAKADHSEIGIAFTLHEK